MKKYIKQIILLALVVSFASCTDDVEIPMTSVGGSISAPTSATPGSITRLDNGVPITFKITTKEGVTATAVEIYRNTAGSTAKPIVLGAKVADATIASDGKAAVYNSSSLGSFNEFPSAGGGSIGTTGTFPLAVKATFSDGTTTITPYVQTVGKGIVWKVKGATSATSGVTSFKLNDPTPVEVSFAAVKKPETVLTSIVGQWSKNGGAYSNLPDTFAATTATKTVDIAAIPYSTYGGLVAGDFITYKFIVTAGTQTDFITTKVTIDNQEFGGSSMGALSQAASMNEFSFATGENYPSGSEDGEIMFSPNFGFMATPTSTITFVENTGLDYDTADLFEAQAAYNAGTPVTSLTDLSFEKVILYKVSRDGEVTYGLVKVTELTLVTTSTLIQGFKFEYKEGELME